MSTIDYIAAIIIIGFLGYCVFYGVAFIIAFFQIIIDAITGKNKGSTYYGGGRSYSSRPTTNSASANNSYSSSGMNGFLYQGRTSSMTIVTATYRDGHIFDGCNYGTQDFSRIIASYQNGFIYEDSVTSYMGNVLGRYENGFIYRGNSTSYSDQIGRYQNGNIYKGTSTSSSNVIGKYTGDDEGGAAAAIVYLFN